MIDTLLFDLGNVLVRWDPRHHYRDRFATEAEMEAFLAEICPPAWNHEMDAGKPFATAIAERQALYPAWAEHIAEWQSGWTRMLGEPLHEMVELLPAWRAAGYRLFALTNWSAETFPLARARFPWLDTAFEHVVVSGEVGVAKPDPAIFALALERAARPPAQVLFIDDSPVNTAAARRLGLATITFESPAQCREEMARLGV